ncbi:type II secretion system protein [Colwellia demingiae]|uniref:Type II secretion system protein n=1 Tax=Colwellia demingiae TaxID=89401 RepID=A0A5C6QN81_9GAMM|nr:type II secretion system protein [Colwellia demingiae]TWX70676.1 type II secretion system protein [Colwellia demingiae]
MLFSYSRLPHKGFTLIETIVGIVVLAISFSVLTTLIYPLSKQSADQLHQIKAAELAQSMLNEIQNKAFDQNSDMAGGLRRCGEATSPLPCSTAMGMEIGEARSTFNDVDDYNNLNYDAGEIVNSQEQLLPLYIGYSMRISVCNDASYDGSCPTDISEDAISTAKLITVTITTPTDFSMRFSTYRANF